MENIVHNVHIYKVTYWIKFSVVIKHNAQVVDEISYQSIIKEIPL